MAILAIKGHATRGKEVIQLLEMLGGNTYHNLMGNEVTDAYYIRYDGRIGWNHCTSLDDCTILTLEQFLEKFPYKVGDKVLYNNKTMTITKMVWEETTNIVAYKLDDKLYCNVIEELQSYTEQKEEKDMEENKGIFIGLMPTSKGHEIVPNKGYEIKQDGERFYVVKKQPQYPKTYEECCWELLLKPERATYSVCGLEYKRHLIVNLQRLLICRDAYWKIAGEQMGLGKPWEPDYKDGCVKYTITIAENEIYTDVSYIFNYVLIFPTEEMRDTFYNNFEKLIEECKELL